MIFWIKINVIDNYVQFIIKLKKYKNASYVFYGKTQLP